MQRNVTINAKKMGRTLLENENRICIIEVELVKGRRIITVRSGIKVVNRCPIAWKIGCVIGDNDDVHQIGVVEVSAIIT